MTDLQHPPVTWTSLRRSPDDDRPPAPLVTAIAFAALLGWVGLATAADVPHAAMVAGVALVVGIAAWWLTVPASALNAVIAFLVVDGFVDGSYGTLSWNGTPDLVLLVLLLLLCVSVPEARRELRGPVETHAASRIRQDDAPARQGSVNERGAAPARAVSSVVAPTHGAPEGIRHD